MRTSLFLLFAACTDAPTPEATPGPIDYAAAFEGEWVAVELLVDGTRVPYPHTDELGAVNDHYLSVFDDGTFLYRWVIDAPEPDEDYDLSMEGDWTQRQNEQRFHLSRQTFWEATCTFDEAPDRIGCEFYDEVGVFLLEPLD